MSENLEALFEEAVAAVYDRASGDELLEIGPVRPWVLKRTALQLFDNPSQRWGTAVRHVIKSIEKRYPPKETHG